MSVLPSQEIAVSAHRAPHLKSFPAASDDAGRFLHCTKGRNEANYY
jgi:hypothetical protein